MISIPPFVRRIGKRVSYFLSFTLQRWINRNRKLILLLLFIIPTLLLGKIFSTPIPSITPSVTTSTSFWGGDTYSAEGSSSLLSKFFSSNTIDGTNPSVSSHQVFPAVDCPIFRSISSSSIMLFWHYPLPELVRYYEVYQKKQGEQYKKVWSGNTDNCEINDLRSSTEYFYYVLPVLKWSNIVLDEPCERSVHTSSKLITTSQLKKVSEIIKSSILLSESESKGQTKKYSLSSIFSSKSLSEFLAEIDIQEEKIQNKHSLWSSEIEITNEENNDKEKQKTVERAERYNYVQNPSFESLSFSKMNHDYDPNYRGKMFASHWEPFMAPYELDWTKGHSGEKSLLIDSTNNNDKWGSSQFILVNQSFPIPIKLTAYSSSWKLIGQSNAAYSITMDVLYSDHTFRYGQSLKFDTGTHDWQRKCLVFYPSKPIEAVLLFITFTEHVGTVWFDDVELLEFNIQNLPSHYDQKSQDSILQSDSKESFNPNAFVEEEGFCEVILSDDGIQHGCCPDRTTIYADKDPDTQDVSLITQMTVDRLPILQAALEAWGGPASVAVYLLNPEDILKLESARLEPIIRDNVDFHIVKAGKKGQFAFTTMGLYPVNTLRNVAWKNTRTLYGLMVDVDFIPNVNSNSQIKALLSYSENRLFLQNRGVWVVPAFEIEPEEGIPETKEELLELASQNAIRQVHKKKWNPAHAATDYSHWYETNNIYSVAWEPEYEPYIIAHVPSLPLWDERFVGYGFDKVSHIAELAISRYRFSVLPSNFIVHIDHGIPSWRGKADAMRVRVYQNYFSFIFEKEMEYKTVSPAYWIKDL